MKDVVQLKDRSADCHSICTENSDFPRPVSSTRTVLIVEDNRLIREMLTRLLSKKGFRIITANDGYEGLIAAIHESPNVIVSDIEMPVMNGEEMVRNLRALNLQRETPVIFFSGHLNKEKSSMQIADGIIYLSKSCQTSEILSAIHICLS